MLNEIFHTYASEVRRDRAASSDMIMCRPRYPYQPRQEAIEDRPNGLRE